MKYDIKPGLHIEQPKDEYDKNGLIICNKKRCSTCIFNKNQNAISEEYFELIKKKIVEEYASRACHQTGNVCKGARELQIKTLHQNGIIPEATEKAFNTFMISMAKIYGLGNS